jgi:actin-related protein 8
MHSPVEEETYEPHFKFSSIPIFQPIHIKGVASTYLRTDQTFFQRETRDETKIEPERVIVIQPGSRNLRIGLATDAFPKIVPHVIARRIQRPTHLPFIPIGKEDDPIFLSALEGVEHELSIRLTKRKLINNPHQQVSNTCYYEKVTHPL